MTPGSRLPTAISRCPTSMLKMWPPRSRSTSRPWRLSLPVKPQATARRGGHTSTQALATIQLWPSVRAKRWVLAFVRRVCPEPNTRAVIAIGSIVRAPSVVQDADLVYIYKSHRPDLFHHPLDADVRVYD